MVEEPENYLSKIAQMLFDKKSSNIIAIDVQGISLMTDYVIIADGNVERHVLALAKEVEKVMEEASEKPVHVEGMQSGDWVILDYFEIVVHLFVPKMREKYQLERLWPEGKVIDLNLQEKRIAK